MIRDKDPPRPLTLIGFLAVLHGKLILIWNLKGLTLRYLQGWNRNFKRVLYCFVYETLYMIIIVPQDMGLFKVYIIVYKENSVSDTIFYCNFEPAHRHNGLCTVYFMITTSSGLHYGC